VSLDVLARSVLTVGRVGAGTGCKYLTEQVAAGKDDFAELSPTQTLAYYSEVNAHGESPGRWLGRGLDTLGLAGSVSAAELENLVGKARHPHYDQQLQRRAVALLNDRSLTLDQRRAALSAAEKDLYLGRAFATYESAADRAERAVADLGEDADEASRDAVRARVLAEGDRQAVAAYELTFTPVKSVSVLAASGGDTVWQEVLDAHRAAVDTAMEYVQDHAAYSRAGVNGIRQIDTRGLIVAAFEHRMSREKDPNIHTHAIVANRVLCADGAWRTVDGRAVYAASVGARAVYEQALEVELAQRLGVRFSTDERRTIREIHGIPLAVIEAFSKRDAAIKKAMAEQVEGYIRPGRGWHNLHRMFTLSTRPGKTGAESSAAAIGRWQRELVAAGYDPAQLLEAATHPARRDPRPRSDGQIVAEAVAVLNQTRAVWTRHHAVLAASRVLPPPPGVGFDEQQARVEGLVVALLAESVQVTPPDLLSVGPSLRRASDAQNVFTAHDDVLYSARSTVDAEQRILAALEDADAPLMTPAELAASVARVPLGDDQDAAVHAVMTSGARISAIVGPAGSGKTYVQRAIAAAWKDGDAADSASSGAPGSTAGHREVLALAPSQIAASVLAESIGARAENVPKWLTEHRRQTKAAAQAAAKGKTYLPDPAWTLQPGQLVIIDEAGMVTTRELDAVLTSVRKAGAKLLLVGDDKQLGAIGAGGMFATIVDRTNAPVLSTVRRFRDQHGRLREWECLASLGLRNRDLDAIAEYERRGRIHAGPLARMEETSYRAWLSDHLAFQHPDPASGTEAAVGQAGVALLMADTEAAAAALSARARADLVRRGLVEQRGVSLADGNRAGVGDLVVTRLNERRIRAQAGEGFVANRETWRVVERGRDGSLNVVSLTSIAADGTLRQLRLPAGYVSANVQLAYAGTVHSAQGRTVTTARGLVTESTSAQALYVMMSRGQRSNDAYVVTEHPDREAHQRWPEQHHMSVLAAILEREDQPGASVTDVDGDLVDQATSIGRLRVIFADLSTVVRGGAYEHIIADQVGRQVADRAVTDPAWATLVRALGTAQMLGWDSRALLIQVLTQRDLAGAGDVAAVLHWRAANITGHWREAPEGPSATDAAAHTAALSWTERADAILDTARGNSLTAPVSVDAADALGQVAHAMDGRVDALALRLAEQATLGQQGGYEGGTTPTWLRALGPVPTSGLNVPARRDAWLTQARAVALYQDAVGYEPPSEQPVRAAASPDGGDRDDDRDQPSGRPQGEADPIGARPPVGDTEARELWASARQTLAEAPMAATMRAMLPERLHGWVTEGERAETRDQPTYVGHDLRALSLRSRAQRTRVNRLRHEATTATGMLNTAQRRRWRRDETAIASLARTHEQIVGRLTRGESRLHDIERDLHTVTGMHQVWQEWEQASDEVRIRARLAAQELSLRGIEEHDDTRTVSPSVPPAALAAHMATQQGTRSAAAASTTLSGEALTQQYAIQSAAAAWFRGNILNATARRWAAAYLDQRGLSEPATAAQAGYAPSRPGHWSLLTDHLRTLGYSDAAIETAGLATRSRQGELIDRFRDRVVLPILDDANRPIGFLGRKPAGDTNPDNPKYLNPTRTPLYDKSRVLYGLDADAIAKLEAGARAIVVEGPMDRLAIQLAAPNLVPVATCGTALTNTHLDLLAQHTSLDRVILGFDADAAGRKAAMAAGKKLVARGVHAPDVELFTPPDGADPAAILADGGPTRLAETLTDPQHHATLLDLLVDQTIDQYDWSTSGIELRELPIASHAGYEATRLIAETLRNSTTWTQTNAANLQRQLARITERTAVPLTELNNYLLDAAFPDHDPASQLPAADAGIDAEFDAEFDADTPFDDDHPRHESEL
jgi:DNA primase catalytic core